MENAVCAYINSSLIGVKFRKGLLAASGNTVFNLSSNSRIVLYTMTGDQYSRGEYIINVTSDGTVTMTAVHEASYLTMTPGTNRLTVRNAFSLTVDAWFMVFSGNVNT